MYWGRKPLVGLRQVFGKNTKGIVLDPFCGAGTPIVAALLERARVVATDLNPMSVFMTRVLVRPLSIPVLQGAFDSIFKEVFPKAGPAYRMTCPKCGNAATADYILWKGSVQSGIPIAAKVECPYCELSDLRPLSTQEEKHQRHASKAKPQSWYPDNTIHTVSRGAPVPNHYQLFTGRNLSILAEVFASIDRLESPIYKEALQYVFTASLYSCSQMQMFSKKHPASSQGWAALRFYIPPLRKETNVLHAFARRFETFLCCKEALNAELPATRVTQKISEFMDGAEVFVGKMDWAESLKVFGPVATHVFLDPPYNIDIDYFGFSEFWGAWLRMPFDFKAEWHARTVRGGRTADLLNRTAQATSPACRVTLALNPKNPAEWDSDTAIASSPYGILDTGYFLYNNSSKRTKGKPNLLHHRERYYILDRSIHFISPATKPTTCSHGERPNEATYPYLRVMAYFKPHSKAESLRQAVLQLVPNHLHNLCQQLEDSEVNKARDNAARNMRTYCSFCLSFVNLLLQRDQWQLISANNRQVEPGAFDLPKPVRTQIPSDLMAAAVFASRDETNQIYFYFPEQAGLAMKAKKISKRDSGQYKQIAVLVLPSRAKMDKCRSVTRAANWRRGFFVSLDELRAHCAEVVTEKYQMLSCTTTKPTGSGNKIATFTAEVKKNDQVGGKDAPYWKLQFKASGLTGIVPGQFIMMDTVKRKLSGGTRPMRWREFTTSFKGSSKTYLKRPFGIHRAFYPNFEERDYLCRLKLPRFLAMVMHTALPNAFDIFYKVLPNGEGTKEMTELKRRERVKMIGPLGSRFDIRAMVNEGVDEVHVIGGGVGMAPLVFLVQSLRYLGVRVKAFIGIQTIGLLKYQEGLNAPRTRGDDIDKGFAAGVRDANIYVDDLEDTGVTPGEIFVSCDKPSDIGQLIPRQNYATGFVSERYKQYLMENYRRDKVVAFACGPTLMMKAVSDIAKQHGVRLYVLMEKRMACGIGVCLSCVCRTTTGGSSGYSRVCKEGPVFNANEILWP